MERGAVWGRRAIRVRNVSVGKNQVSEGKSNISILKKEVSHGEKSR
jgi:hypothetical protein